MKRKSIKNIVALLLCALMVLSLVACQSDKKDNDESKSIEASTENTTVQEEKVDIRVGAMSGPTAFGMVKLKSDAESGKTENSYKFNEFATEASAFVAPLSTGAIDIAAVPSNLAATIFNNTEGKIKVLAVSTLGVLSLVERGNSVTGMADLKGKTVYATGQGAVPEYTIRYILKARGIDPDKDLTIQWCSDTTEAMSYITKATDAIAILPQPFATVAQTNVSDLRVVSDLNDEWASLETGCEIVTGVVVVRTEFAEKYPNQVAKFVEEYEKSANYATTNVEETAKLIADYGIVPKAPLAQKALPKSHVVCLTGDKCKKAMNGFLKVLFDANPKSVGGKLPGDELYYNK